MKNTTQRKLDILIKKYGSKCFYCKKKLQRIEIYIDHVIAKARGGVGSIDNYRPSCCYCNTTKWSYPPREWRIRLLNKYIKARETAKYFLRVVKTLEEEGILEMEDYEN